VLTNLAGLWMQDKPALQQGLSRDLASLVSTLRPTVTLPFLRAFWITMAREWTHIEALRLDKYLYLIRQYLNASFQHLSKKKWKPSLVEQWNTIVRETPLNPSDMKIPNGLRYHVLDIWVDELEKVDSEWEAEDKREILEKLVEPIEEMAKDGKLKVLRVAAKETLSDDTLRAWRGQEDEVMEEVEEDSEEEWGGFAE
jgi:ribosomal RNA-processing protein 1